MIPPMIAPMIPGDSPPEVAVGDDFAAEVVWLVIVDVAVGLLGPGYAISNVLAVLPSLAVLLKVYNSDEVPADAPQVQVFILSTPE